jgi:hypothetical protein
MERSLFRIIRNKSESPNVTILLPAQKTGPGSLWQIMPVVKLLNKARLRLLQEFESHRIAGVLSKLERIPASIDHSKMLEGMAIFVNDRISSVIHLPFPVKEKLVIGRDFAAYELINIFNRDLNYYALSLGTNFIRLFEAHRDNFSEITECGFPFVNPETARENPRSKGQHSEEVLNEFFRIIVTPFMAVYNQHPMHVVLAGPPRYIELFRQLSGVNCQAVNTTGINCELSENELSHLVWPQIRMALTEKSDRILS